MRPEPKKRTAYRRGLWAENLAAGYLRVKGYRILERRYKTKGGEIDLIAAKGETLAFVEVKARRDQAEALYAVNQKTQRRVEQAALHFLADYPDYSAWALRFDVIAISGPFSIKHLDNAWEARS